jgi:surfeit locus 1 family protein
MRYEQHSMNVNLPPTGYIQSIVMTHSRTSLVPLIFMVIATSMLVSLGVWQLQRLQWKNDLLAQIDQAQHEPALGNLPELPDPKAIDALAFRKVILQGRFLYDHTLHLVGRPKEAGIGTANGFFLMTPFELDDDGRIILINRGFSPVGKESMPDGVITVQGVIRPARTKRYFAPENKPERNVWFYEDVPAMKNTTGLDITPVIVEATGQKQKGMYPIPHNGHIRMRNDHLYYAITWFSIAFIGVIMFIIYTRKPKSS